jgi:hypothetical protein
VIINTVTPPENRSRLGVGGRNRVDVENSAEEILDNPSLALLASLLDALDLSLGVLVGFGLGLLVALTVLSLKLLVFLLLLGLVVGYLLLGFITSFPDALGAVLSGLLDNLGSILLSVEELFDAGRVLGRHDVVFI